MTIALLAHQQFPLEAVAATLQVEGVAALTCAWETTPHSLALPEPVDVAVLILPEQGILKLGKRTKETRRRLGGRTELLLCAPQMTGADRELLSKFGVSEIISPRSWAASEVAERILAELIGRGGIQPATCGRLRGATRQMRELYWHIEKLAPLNEPVLILGETGTGKELVASELHQRSGRKEPLLAINCAEFTPELLASELFGHAQGAFTDARQTRKGLLAKAGSGTVFLDEIGDLDQQAQAKLLRVLEERKFRAVGADEWQAFNARLVLATHRDLDAACAAGKFRRDLLARITDYRLALPPLRERLADIPLLVRHFVQEYNHDYSKQQVQVPAGVLDCLFQSEWLGNVRQLRKVVRQAATYADQDGNLSAVVLQEAASRREHHRLPNTVSFDPAADTWRTFLQRAQSAYFHALLDQTGGNKEAAIRISGLSRSHFYDRLKELDKKDDENQPAPD